MILNKSLIADFSLLMQARQYEAARAWFTYSKSKETHKVERVTSDGKVYFIDTGVEEEFIDKVLIWGNFFMNDYLRDESPSFHRDLIAFIFSKSNEYNAAPRGFSKTTMIQLCISFMVVNRMETFIVLIEKSFTEAAEVISAVRDVLKTNKRVQTVYGKLSVREAEEDDTKDPDAKGDLLLNGVRIRGKGFNTTIRGLKSKHSRPSKIILDDVESDEHINNPDQRRKYLDNYNKGIQPAVDIAGTIKVFGTILHFDSLLANLIKWHSGKVYRAYDPKDPENTLLWPQRWTFALLEKKREEMTSEHGSSAFAQEYLNDPVSDEVRAFRQEWLWRASRQITFEAIKGKRMNGYAALDFADSLSARADFTGVVVHLVDAQGNRYRVSCQRQKLNVLGKINLIFDVWKKWHPWGLREIGIEKKAFTDEVLPMFELECAKRNIYPILSELKPMKRAKSSRIKGNLQGPYETGKIWTIIDEEGNPIEDTEALLNELYNFPASKNDDLSDAEAYISDMLQIPLDDSPTKEVSENMQDDPFAGLFDKEVEIGSQFPDDDPFK